MKSDKLLKFWVLVWQPIMLLILFVIPNEYFTPAVGFIWLYALFLPVIYKVFKDD